MQFALSQQAIDLGNKRYFMEGEDWEKMCNRVSEFLADDAKSKAEFFHAMHKGLFLPNTPCLVNAGKPEGQLSACFVLPVGDSIEEIFDSIKNTALVHKTGGGTGFNFSSLRPEGSTVKSTKGVSSGPISFMKVFDAATQQMKQGGVRRGANMGMLNIDHPDIVKFIKCKHTDKKISNFNISVAITDEFMNNLINLNPDVPWICKFKDTCYLIQHNDDTPVETKFSDKPKLDEFYSAKEIWDLICKQAWRNGEPGIIFIDEIRRKNGKSINATNPCGEQPLEDYEACCLGSIDLSKFVSSGGPELWNFIGLREIVRISVDMLNQIIDKSYYPLKEIEEKVKSTRKIGLGVMGWADVLIKRQIRYGSKESLGEAENIMHFIQGIAKTHSEERGYNNKTVTTIAPTGSISILAGCSSGIEPVIGWVTKHHREDFEDWITTHDLAEPYLNENFEAEDMPEYFVTAEDISPAEHIDMQAAFQAHIDNAVSKTINLPANATEQDVRDVLVYAWEKKCKGVTVYREDSRQDQVISKVTQEEDSPHTPYEVSQDALTWEEFTEQMGLPEERPYCLDGYIFKMPVDMGGGRVENAYLCVGMYEGIPYEMFVIGNIRDADEGVAQSIDSITRLASLSLRGGVPLDKVIEQLEKITCGHIFSVPHKVAHVLKEFLAEDNLDPCPECGEKIFFSEGCEKCNSCGWARCG
jgi:ribonucleoside-diphosphate reductase alpha chain